MFNPTNAYILKQNNKIEFSLNESERTKKNKTEFNWQLSKDTRHAGTNRRRVDSLKGKNKKKQKKTQELVISSVGAGGAVRAHQKTVVRALAFCT